LSARQIAVLISCSHDAVNRALERFGIGKKGTKLGPVTYGWKLVHGKRFPHVRQQNTIGQICSLSKKGWSMKKISNHLNHKGITPPTRSKMWHPSMIARILVRMAKIPY